MDSKDILTFFFFLGMFVILYSTTKAWFKHKKEVLILQSEMTAEKAAQYAAKTDRLEQRMQVLERLLTDKSTHLADEIENLREPKH